MIFFIRLVFSAVLGLIAAILNFLFASIVAFLIVPMAFTFGFFWFIFNRNRRE